MIVDPWVTDPSDWAALKPGDSVAVGGRGRIVDHVSATTETSTGIRHRGLVCTDGTYWVGLPIDEEEAFS